MEPKECCNNCRYIRKLKHNFISEYGFEESYCCVVWEYSPKENKKDIDAWIQEIDNTGRCELFDLKDGINN